MKTTFNSAPEDKGIKILQILSNRQIIHPHMVRHGIRSVTIGLLILTEGHSFRVHYLSVTHASTANRYQFNQWVNALADAGYRDAMLHDTTLRYVYRRLNITTVSSIECSSKIINKRKGCLRNICQTMQSQNLYRNESTSLYKIQRSDWRRR